MDIKTSVNKIGEIINLSQELNSLLWDKMYHGSSYNDVKELYYDICQLDVMSGIEIDKAKKEFDIDNSKELDKMREKYKEELSDEYHKKKMPHFFSHISRQKGYYNPEKKNYCKYHTSMDYLQTVVNGFKIKNPYKKDWLPFVAILDNSKFRTSDVNQKQINKIYSLLKKYVTDRKILFASDLATEEKRSRNSLLYESLKSDIESETIGFSTMFRLLSSIENKENSQIKNILLPMMFLCGNKSFVNNIIHSIQDIDCLEPDGNDIKLFNINYKITKKRANSEINHDFHPYT